MYSEKMKSELTKEFHKHVNEFKNLLGQLGELTEEERLQILEVLGECNKKI